MHVDRLLRIVQLRLRSLVHRDAVERDLDDELAYHLERQTEEFARQGMTPAAARAAAGRAFGAVAYHKDQVRDTRGTRWLDELASDVRFAFRSLNRARGFALTVVLTLALGIGANTAMFTLLRGTLLRPLPNRDAGRLVYLRQSAVGTGQTDMFFSVPEVQDYRAASTTLSEIAEYSNVMPFTMIDRGGRPVKLDAAVVTGNYFDVMGLRPALGQVMSPRDDGAAAAPVSVLSYEFWKDHFGGDPRVVGRTVTINERPSTILGVLEPVPQYPRHTDVYINTVTSPHHLSATMVTGRTHRMSEVFARLAPNATVAQARVELARISAAMFRDHPDAYEKAAKFQISVLPLRDAVNEKASRMFWLLMGAAAFVLLIACANVANLTLMRGVSREREMLVRAALGAGRLRLRRLLIVENLVLTLVGASIGVLVAFAGLRLLVSFAAQFSPRANEIRVDALVLTLALATSVVVAVVLAFVPRIGGGGATPLAPAGRRSTLGRARQRLQRSLVVAQVGACMVLLTGAGLLMRTIDNLDAVQTGVRTDHVLTMELPLEGDIIRQIMNQPANLAKYQAMRDRVASLPGVELVSVAGDTPLSTNEIDLDVKAEGRVVAPNHPTPQAAFKNVDTRYFDAAGIPLIAGRTFTEGDRRGSPPVVVLNRSFAKEVFGDENPIGRRIAWTGEVLKFTPFGGDWRTVVGIVGDTRDKLDGGPTATMYEPFAQEAIMGGALIVRTASDPTIVQRSITDAIRQLSSRQLIEHVATIDQIRDETVAPRRLNAMFIASFGALAFVIAMVGIAGVLAFSVSSRTAEIGIRMSLGADAQRVHRMVLGEGGTLLGAGLFIGTMAALLAARLLQSLLFGVTAHDPATLGAVAFVLASVGVAACWIPAARAAQVDPAVALRAE